jgi:gluconokinase
VPPDASSHNPDHAQTTWQDAAAPLVLAIDIGSSSVRALMFDVHGRQIELSEHQIPHRLHTTSEGAAEADAENLFELVSECVDGALALAKDRQGDIAAVATSSFWHGMMGIDASGAPTSPIYMWGDTRSGDEVDVLRDRLDAAQMHQETGCRFHSSYWPAKLLWLCRERPKIVADTATWCSFADFVDLRLRSQLATSVSMASGTGLLRTATSTWHDGLLDAIDLDPGKLPTLTDRADPLPRLTASWRSRWPALADIPWFPALGDGAGANLGAGAVGNDRIAVTIGTSGAMRVITEDGSASHDALSGRLWAYRLDRTHRVTGGALSNGGNVAGWLARYFAGGDFGVLARDAERMAPDSHGLTVLPLLAGERSPSWTDDATGVFAGITLATRPPQIYRAVLEATAYRFAAIHEALAPLLTPDHATYANGAAALKSPLWLQIIADTLGVAVSALDADAEASARGVAISALQSIGALDHLRPDHVPIKHTYEANGDAHAAYHAGWKRQQALEAAMAGFWSATG